MLGVEQKGEQFVDEWCKVGRMRKMAANGRQVQTAGEEAQKIEQNSALLFFFRFRFVSDEFNLLNLAERGMSQMRGLIWCT